MNYWDSYWKSKPASSCLEGLGAAPRLEECWRESAKIVTKEGNGQTSPKRFLDVACGSGAASTKISKECESVKIKFTGIDRANVDFSLENPIHSVSFYNGENFNAFFKRSESFDAIISNFGIEYLELEEIRTILETKTRPGSLFIANCHDHNSLVSFTSKEEIKALDSFLNDRLLKKLEVALSQGFSVSLAKDYLLRLKQLNDQSEGRLAGAGVTEWVIQQLSKSQQRGEKTCELDMVHSVFEDYKSRLYSQINASLKTPKILNLLQGVSEECLKEELVRDSQNKIVSKFFIFRML
ncbi:class I SAM-dependent methyltransferase [Idiomarina seosinensis]|uniref:Uncharacterized protein n=1 Tax=Idiomarina seosinensis TaxID=281739 RepID=A0A432ZGQ1_9GAMM|nr:class I SAM-dependent methyltransferase [Idiomarina seosinensis]RUO77000.1 hypothetical protein CWI81_00385 [Idiomarina seosinensis]